MPAHCEIVKGVFPWGLFLMCMFQCEGPQLGPFRVSSLAVLLFNVLIAGRRSWTRGEDKEGRQLGPFQGRQFGSPFI